ncbi:hypothetical protein BC943DRAFT_157421 [Umbelopsis sp. AD052]|nr:hypothetical protein BC943DRAFT_157421 [Umbelopsis sp. AD052]
MQVCMTVKYAIVLHCIKYEVKASGLLSTAFISKIFNRTMKRSRPRHRPEERYDVDGSIIKSKVPHKKVWDLREILDNPESKAKALKEAQNYIKTAKPSPSDSQQSSEQPPWSDTADDIFFSKEKRGLATFFLRRGSPRYDEFKGFYRKYGALRQWKIQSENETISATSTGQALKDESETIRNAVILFHDYHRKQQAAQKAKIEKDRDSLPITKYEKAIVHTLRKHRVLLIAGDTGCGKSTQGRCC